MVLVQPWWAQLGVVVAAVAMFANIFAKVSGPRHCELRCGACEALLGHRRRRHRTSN